MKAINKCGIECVQLERGFDVKDIEILKKLETTAHLTEREYEAGDNSDRNRGFTNSPYHSIAGRFFQFEIKGLIRKSLDTIEWWIEHKYDKDAFIYDSEWIKKTDSFTESYIEERFQQAAYKLRIMHQIRHISFFMAKEDPFYTCVLKEFCVRIAEFVMANREMFELSESERYQLDKWHNGTAEEIRARPRDSIDAQPWMQRG